MNTYWGKELVLTQALKARTRIAADDQLNTSAKLNDHIKDSFSIKYSHATFYHGLKVLPVFLIKLKKLVENA